MQPGWYKHFLFASCEPYNAKNDAFAVTFIRLVLCRGSNSRWGCAARIRKRGGLNTKWTLVHLVFGVEECFRIPQNQYSFFIDNTVKRSSVSLNHKEKPFILRSQENFSSFFFLLCVRGIGAQVWKNSRSQVKCVVTAMRAAVKPERRDSVLLVVARRYISSWRLKHDACFLNVSRWDSASDPVLAVEFKLNVKRCSVKRF